MYKLENKTVKGLSPLTINRTAENKMKVYPHGNTYQATRSGKNLYNVNDKYSFTDIVSVDKDGWITVTYDNTSGTSTKYFDFKTNVIDKLKVNTNYALIVEIKEITGTGNIMFSQNHSSSQCATSNSYTFSKLATGIKKYIMKTRSDFSTATNSLSSYGSFTSGQSGSITFRMSLLEDTSITPETFIYEAYGVMPSPDYPSRIRNVGDNINLINIYDLNTEGYSYTNNGITFTFLKDGAIKLNGTATADTSVPLIGAYKSGNYKLNLDEKYTQSGLVSGVSLIFYNLTTQIARFYNNETKEVKGQIDYVILAVDNGRSLDNVIIYPKLEPGTIPTPYTPYNCGSADFKVENKNKFNKNKATTKVGWFDTNGKITNGGNSTIVENYTEIPNNKNITINAKGLEGIVLYNKDKEFIKKITTNNKDKYTFKEENVYFIRFQISTSKLDLNSIQIEEGDTSTDYVPHQEQIKSFPFAEGQVLHKGDYLASDGIHQKRKIYEITGNEDFIFTVDKNRIYIEVSKLLDNIKIDFSNETKKPNLLCSQFTIYPFETIYKATNLDGIGVSSGNNLSIFIKGFTSLDDYKAYLTEQYANGTPVTIEYELAEEIVIPYTEEQEQVLNHIYSYEETTNIDIISEFETEIDVEYTPQFLQEIKDKFIKGPTFGRIHILDTDENFTQDNYLKDFSVSELRFVPDKGLFGGCVAKKVDVNFNNVNKQFSIQDKEFEAYLGVDYEDERYEIKYGTFIVQHPETEDTTDNTSFTALDYMIKFNQKYIDYVTYPCTLRDIAESICIQAGVTLSEEKFRNDDFIVENNQFVNGENLRQVLQGIALSAFSWARVDENNELHFDLNQKEDIDIELTPNEYYNLSKDDYEYGPINRIIIRDSQIEGENVTIDDKESMTENGIIELVIEDNPFAYTQEKREQLIKAGKELFGFRYMPVNDVSLIGLAFLNSKDKIRFKTLDGEVFDTYLFDHTINYNGVILDNIQSKALTKTETRYIYKPDITQAIKNTQIIVDKANQTINQIIEKQDEQSSQLVNIETDLSGVHTTIQDNQKDIEEKINEIEQTIEGTKQTLTYKGGNNIFYYAKEFWNNGTEGRTANLEEYTDTEIQQKSVSGNAYMINKGTSEQKNVVKNDTYTISFTYKKLIDLATGYVDINGTRIDLTSTDWKEEVITEVIDTNTIDIKIVSDTANAFKIFDLMGAVGNEKQVWTQNPNETRTDTVIIGKGIQVNSSSKNTYARFDADGNRVYNKSTEEVTTELTDLGVRTDYIGPTLDISGNRKTNKAELGGILIQEIDNQTWFSSLL